MRDIAAVLRFHVVVSTVAGFLQLRVIPGEKAFRKGTRLLLRGSVKPQPGDISIVEKTGTFLMWYDTNPRFSLTPSKLRP
jgi:hypothetical protein